MQNVTPYKIIDTSILVSYKLEDFKGKDIYRHRRKLYINFKNNDLSKQNWLDIEPETNVYDDNLLKETEPL